ncbi:hypothetical protein BOTBODRAFT_60006 [Botryobasidium botryosum FD-172 SS1]|uniref:BTB domain-containing protein n=1 Tax=Botryobasidium botryosum (strain FD-172 SS1) TaxID=930990 RepID=A0A067M778_BOTB1|nr:hypothetical protein BOTBODRAFT_60006 [Botryobasidium botryosum FD-172 SS1]
MKPKAQELRRTEFRSSQAICRSEKYYNIKWTVTVPTGPSLSFVKAQLQSSTPLYSRAGKITWTHTAENDSNEVLIKVYTGSPLDSAAPGLTSLHMIASPADIDKPTIHRQSVDPEFCIRWEDVVQLLSPQSSDVEICITMRIDERDWMVMSNGIETPSMRNLAQFTKALGTLDVPGNHDVMFQFSKGRRLYADRVVLQRESSYFRTLLNSGFRESGAGNEAASQSISRASDWDSDADSDEEGDSAESLTVKNVESPIPAVVPSSKKRKLATPSGSEEACPTTISISNASYRTVRAVLYYLYSEHIAFAPLSSSLSTQSGADSRKDMIQAYLRANTAYPVPVSAKSVYALADIYELPALTDLAMLHFKKQLTKENVLTELFGTFCRLYDKPRDVAIKIAVANWAYLKETEKWGQIAEEAKADRDVYYMDITFKLLGFKD